jgi:hypothetical protein
MIFIARSRGKDGNNLHGAAGIFEREVSTNETSPTLPTTDMHTVLRSACADARTYAAVFDRVRTRQARRILSCMGRD